MTNETKIALKELVFCCIERIVMTKKHLDGVNNYILRRNSEDFQTGAFYDCLKRVLKGLIYNASKCELPIDEDAEEKAYKKIYSLFNSIKELQEELTILPKEDAPKELHRFLRNFNDQIPKNKEEEVGIINHVLYLCEQQSSSIFERSPLAEFEKDTFSGVLEDVTDDLETGNEHYRWMSSKLSPFPKTI